MKEIYENKTKLYLFTIVLFLLTSIIIKALPNDVSNIVCFIVFPLYFLILTLGDTKKNKSDYQLPIILTLIYLFVGYICIPKIIDPLKVIIAYTSSLIPIFLIEHNYKKKNKKINVSKIKENSLQTKSIISYSMPLVITILLEFYYSITTYDIARLPISFLSAIVCIIIIYSIYFVMLGIFKKTSTSTIVFGILLLIVHVINEGRIFYTGDTLLLSDVIFLQNAGEVAGFADVSIIRCIGFIIFPTLLAIIILLYLFKVAKRNDLKVTYNKSLLVKVSLSVIALLVLFIPNEKLDNFIVNKIYNVNDNVDNAIKASNKRYFNKYGVISGLYGKLIETRRFKPNNYNEEELKEILNSAPKNKGTWNKPNIIVIFSESFWDISRLTNVKFDNDVTPNYNRLKEIGKSIQMISPAYGGLSANTEFEIMTGGSLNYFSKGYTPYMQLFKKGISDDNPTIIKELKNNGYKTKILNSSTGKMFNCSKVYDIYGIDEVNHLHDEIDLNGKYVTDKYLTDQMIKYFNSKDEDEKIFYFTITMGGHMPYFEEKYDNYHVNIVESPYESDINEVLHSYAEGIYLADKELGRIYDYIQSIDEDTLIVFFGDHLPYLSTPNGKDSLFEINYLNYDYNVQSVYNQYNTSALILSNYNIEYDDTKYLSPDLLMSYVLNNMDLELSPFYRWLYSTIDTLPSSNYVVSQDKKGNLYYTLTLTDEMKEMYDLRNKIQYMLFK